MNQERLMNQEIDNDEITIDLTELFMALWSRLHIILMAGVLGALIAFVGTNLLVTPMYTSETKVYVLTRSDSTAGITYNDLQMGTQLTQDYMQLVTSRPVLEQVIAVLNLDMEPGQLKDMISVETPEGDPYLKYPRPERRSQTGQRNRRCGKRLCQYPDHGDHGRRCGQHGGGRKSSYQPLIAQYPQEHCHWRPFGSDPCHGCDHFDLYPGRHDQDTGRCGALSGLKYPDVHSDQRGNEKREKGKETSGKADDA